MKCRYGKVYEERGNYLAAIGTSATMFEGHLLADSVAEQCFYTKEELENMDLDVLEVVKIEDKYKGFQEFIQMAIRWGADIKEAVKMPYTHEERVKMGEDFLEKVKKINHVSSAELVGSVAEGTDTLLSDVDISINTTECPGEENCGIAKLMDNYILEPVDIWCSSKS